MIVQFILIAVIISLLLYFLQNRTAVYIKAGIKLMFLCFVTFAIVAIARPDFVNDMAHLVGVGRGADLLLYGFVLGFVFFIIGTYFKIRDLEERITKIVRHIAIAEAEAPHNKHH